MPPQSQPDNPAAPRGHQGRAGATVDRQALIAGLNQDLAGEYRAMLTYVLYAAKAAGPHQRTLRDFFQARADVERGHAQLLADKVAALGGEPTTEPRPVPHANHPREMMERLLEIERQAVADYGERIRQAEAVGDVGLKAELGKLIASEARHKEAVERLLAGWGDTPALRPAQEKDPWRDEGGEG